MVNFISQLKAQNRNELGIVQQIENFPQDYIEKEV